MNPPRKDAAFARAELFAIVASVGIIIVAGIGYGRTMGVRNRCTANLKNLALGLVLWSQEHQNRFPMEVPIAEGGTREYALAGDLLPNVLIASSELGKLGTPEFLVCPKDKKRKAAKNFSAVKTDNVSYFLSADAARTNENQIIAGDRNLTCAGSSVKAGLLTVTDPAPVGWARGFHDYGGDVALADGSAHEVTTKGLHELLKFRATNHLIIP